MIITKTFSIKMKEDVGMSKPKKYINNVGRLNVGPKWLITCCFSMTIMTTFSYSYSRSSLYYHNFSYSYN